MRERQGLKGSSGLSGGLKSPFAGIESNKTTSSESTVNYSDHRAARLRRLIEAGHANPKETGWVQVLEPDTCFKDIGTGALVEWECDIYIPDTISTILQAQQNSELFRTMSTLLPAARTLGLDTENIPDKGSLAAMSDFLKGFNIAPVIVGENSDTDWKIVGTVDHNWIIPDAEFDGPSKVIGKVRRTVESDRWWPITSLPGINLVNRRQRREMEKNGPRDEQSEDNFIKGPAVVVDYLAIYT